MQLTNKRSEVLYKEAQLMKLEGSNLIVKRPYKEVYKCDKEIVKVFETTHPKSAVFNEALNTVRV